MPTVVADPGAPNANSYVTRAEADDYHTTRPSSQVAAWTAATADDKDAAVIMATELLDANVQWNGVPVDPDVQSLAWPRTGLVNRNGVEVPIDEIPRELKRATSEFARQLLASNRTADNDVVRQGITDMAVGSIKLSFKDEIESSSVPNVVPDAALLLIPSTWYTVPSEEPTVSIEAL